MSLTWRYKHDSGVVHKKINFCMKCVQTPLMNESSAGGARRRQSMALLWSVIIFIFYQKEDFSKWTRSIIESHISFTLANKKWTILYENSKIVTNSPRKKSGFHTNRVYNSIYYFPWYLNRINLWNVNLRWQWNGWNISPGLTLLPSLRMRLLFNAA